MDDDRVFKLLRGIDSEINELKNVNNTLRNEIEALKSNPVQSGRSPSVEGTSDIEQKWRNIAITFFEDQEKAFKNHRDAVKSEINGIRTDVKKLEANILDMRKQVE